MFNQLKSFFLVTICVSMLTISANAATLYVDVNGDDNNTGGQNDPFATIQKGVDAAVAGDTVHVNTGTYYEKINLNKDGAIGFPIVIEGESGTIVDGSDAVTAGAWLPAPEIGTGVYKQTSYAYEPGSMYINSNGNIYDIPRCRNSSCLTPITGKLATPYDETVKTQYLGVTIDWWDGIEAAFGHSDKTLYVRFRDNSNPGDMILRTSPDDQYVFNLTNDSYITIKDLEIRGAWGGILMSGSDSNNNVIDNCEVYATGRYKIFITSNAHTIEIENSKLYGNGAWHLGGYTLGAWEDGTTGSAPNSQAVKEWVYDGYKTQICQNLTSNLEDDGLSVENAGANIVIHNNEIFDTLSGIGVEGGSVVDIYNNTIHNISSIAFRPTSNSKVLFHDNLLYDNQFNIRFHNMQNEIGRYAYVYNNKFYNPEDIGYHLRFYASATPSPHSDHWIYHNSFVGGYIAIHSGSAESYGYLPKTRFVNNIFSAKRMYYGSQTFWKYADAFEVFAYNWLGGDHSTYTGDAAWYGEGNIDAEAMFVWDNSKLPDFILPEGISAQESGIDLSSNCTINGQTYPSYPGMEPNYYDSDRPNMGVFYAGAEQDRIDPPYNLRIASIIP